VSPCLEHNLKVAIASVHRQPPLTQPHALLELLESESTLRRSKPTLHVTGVQLHRRLPIIERSPQVAQEPGANTGSKSAQLELY
jgi:hypothetical protein